MKPGDNVSAIPQETNICSAVPNRWSYSNYNTFRH